MMFLNALKWVIHLPGLVLDFSNEIVALISGFHSWYIAEQNAITYFEAF